MKKQVFTIALLVLAQSVLAQNVQIPENKTITGVHVYSGKASFTYSPAHSDGAGCSSSSANNTVTVSWEDDQNFKALYSAALAAYTAGKVVGFGVSGCIGGFGGETPKVYRLDVKN